MDFEDDAGKAQRAIQSVEVGGRLLLALTLQGHQDHVASRHGPGHGLCFAP
jgi:hypothetical protein